MTTLPELLSEHGEAITRAVLRAYPPVYTARNRDGWGFDLSRLKRRPMGAQGDAIRATAVSLRSHRGTNVVGEMGTGKTMIAASAAYIAGFRRILVLCPPHLTRKWKREVEETVPLAAAVIVSTITDLNRLPRDTRWPLFVILSRERAKLSYRWTPAVRRRPDNAAGHAVYDERGELVRRNCCPGCWQTVVDDEGVPLDLDELSRRRRVCDRCGSPLWQADHTGPARVPLADYINRRMPGAFDLLVTDESHEYKARGSAQGIAAATLAEACVRTLTLTGTLMGGYASTLFHLLWRFSPDVREEFAYGEEGRWVSRYGIVERITRRGGDDDVIEDGRASRRRGYRTRTVEKPGVSPAVLFHLIANTVFIRLADVATDLPPYREEVRLIGMARGDGDEPSQAGAYRRLSEDLHAALLAALAAGSRRLLGAYLQALLAYPDACTHGETVVDRSSGAVIGSAPALPDDRLYPKEQALVELAVEERRQGRRVLVYITHTETRDLTPRLERVLTEAGLRVAVLKANTVDPDRREEWVTKRVRAGVDVLLVHPRLVQTGLDLIDFPTIVWHEVEYSVYTMRQASRRSWRIGQKRPVRVVYFAYRATLQAQALSLVARKLQASLLVEGEIGDAGLAAYGADADDLTLELARSLADGGDVNEESLEALFAQARLAADGAQEALDARDFALEATPTATSAAIRADEERVLVLAGVVDDDGTQMRLL
ncbi:MAG: DEAD/DEAH box helicase [Dehalococcoidia bacterium]|nr:MAG: DEAD/DEAH box helicase [Dehalococcoidia bacterium]